MKVVVRLFAVALPAMVIALVLVAALFEVWVRIHWDDTRGRPGLFVTDPVRIEKLASGYTGWFAGVRVHTNNLGFRDLRDYALQKGPRTFRILLLGDSVTFGHGSLYEHTYPYLLEQRLKAWRSDIDWQVWNLGVPGYNTSQELAYLLEVGPRFHPDLVVVGFFLNDIVDNHSVVAPTRAAVWSSDVKGALKTRLYSFDWYKKQYLGLRYRLFASAGERALLENLTTQEYLLARPGKVSELAEQRLTNPAALADEELEWERCSHPRQPMFSAVDLQHTPGFAAWLDAVGRLQDFTRHGAYPLMFFINAAPDECPWEDVFDDRATQDLDGYLQSRLSEGTVVVSSHDAFLHYRPSAMPGAMGHSIGNSNVVKADVLFQCLRDRVLLPLIARLAA